MAQVVSATTGTTATGLPRNSGRDSYSQHRVAVKIDIETAHFGGCRRKTGKGIGISIMPALKRASRSFSPSRLPTSKPLAPEGGWGSGSSGAL